MLELSSLAYAPLQPMDDDQSLRLGFIFDVFGLQSWFTCVFWFAGLFRFVVSKCFKQR